MNEINPQSDALKWLLEMELVNDPNVLNSIVLNLHKLSDQVQDVELVLDQPAKRLLVYVDADFGWFRHERKRKALTDAAGEMLEEALPSYTTRVVYDRGILVKALELLKK